ncbi:MAG: hypothetical protein ABJG14_21735 [Sulfitobacter sp.]|uniref:hypothetical protein n=1 Tax=Alphaproteobacteria TaxID=28211 RepID=UPI003262E41F
MNANITPFTEQNLDCFSEGLALLGFSRISSFDPIIDRIRKFSNQHLGCRFRFPISTFAGRGETENGKKNIYDRGTCGEVQVHATLHH